MHTELFTISFGSTHVPNARVLCLSGPLTISNVFDLQREFRTGIWDATVVDMLGVPYMDSAGMGTITNFYVSCQKKGQRFVVCGLNYRVIELFKLTHVDKVITIADDMDHAEALLSAKN